MCLYKGYDSLFCCGSLHPSGYTGHDGMMDFRLPVVESAAGSLRRQAIVLARFSKRFFCPRLQAAGAAPSLWTTHLMALEAYTLHDALRVWVRRGAADEVPNAAVAYAR